MARRKLRVALVNLGDVHGIVEVFKLVYNRHFRSDEVLRDVMVNKIANKNNVLDEIEVTDILHRDRELPVVIAK